jgi:hypothetical protein
MLSHYIFFAYVDPGTGSYLLQLGLASLLGAGYVFRVFWARIMRFFVRRPPSRADDEGR